MPSITLKRRHSLKGKNILPLVRKMKAVGRGDRMPALARLKSNTPLDEMSRDDVISAFRELTGENEKEILEMAQKECTDGNLRLLLHFGIILANEIGEPTGQALRGASNEDEGDTEVDEEIPAPPIKKRPSATVTKSVEKEVESIKDKMSDDNTSTAEKSSDDGPSEAKRLKTDSFPWEEGYTDITLIVEDKPIHTNKGFLMAASPIFKTMFLSAYKEKKAKKIPLPGKTYSDVVQFLQYLSQDVYTPFTDAGVFVVMPLAWEYQTMQLVERCEEYLVDKHFCYEGSIPSLDLLLDFMHMHVMYHRKKLGKLSLDALKFRTQKNIRTLDKFKTLPVHYQIQILASRVDALEHSFRKHCYNKKALEELFKT